MMCWVESNLLALVQLVRFRLGLFLLVFDQAVCAILWLHEAHKQNSIVYPPPMCRTPIATYVK